MGHTVNRKILSGCVVMAIFGPIYELSIYNGYRANPEVYLIKECLIWTAPLILYYGYNKLLKSWN